MPENIDLSTCQSVMVGWGSWHPTVANPEEWHVLVWVRRRRMDPYRHWHHAVYSTRELARANATLLSELIRARHTSWQTLPFCESPTHDNHVCPVCSFPTAFVDGIECMPLIRAATEELLLPKGLKELPSWKEAKPPKEAYSDTIISFGVELEGEIPRSYESSVRAWLARLPRAQAHTDGTVDTPRGGYPAENTFWTTDMPELEAWLEAMYGPWSTLPTDGCGFHVHVRPKPEYYGAFATPEYWSGFEEAYMKFADTRGVRADLFKRRASGREGMGPFRRWSPDLARGRGDRHIAINLTADARHHHGAIEHRILPYMESPKEAVECVTWLLTTAEELITKRKHTYGSERNKEFGSARYNPSLLGVKVHFNKDGKIRYV